MSKLTETTLIPISLVITIVGGVVWLTSMHSEVKAAVENTKEQSNFNKEVIDRLARIETKLENLKKR